MFQYSELAGNLSAESCSSVSLTGFSRPVPPFRSVDPCRIEDLALKMRQAWRVGRVPGLFRHEEYTATLKLRKAIAVFARLLTSENLD
jgi:hypothetical protein